MNRSDKTNRSVLMLAYTNYRTDPRVIRAAEAAAGEGFDVDFLTLRRENDPPQERIRGVQVFHLNQMRYRGSAIFWYVFSYLEFFLRCFMKTTRLQFAKRYRVVHVNNMPDFFVFCALLPKLMGAKVLLDIHDPMPNTFASKFKTGDDGSFFKILLLQERVSARFADRVLTVHDPLKDHILVRQHGLAPEAIQVVANFADDELFAPRCPACSDGRLRLVFHGSILERYGLRDAMHAIARMRFRDRISVRIIGEGDFSEALKSIIASLCLNGVVRFDNQMYPLEEIPAQLADCNLGLVPLELSSITNYALPLKLLEYLSLGMPSVTVRNAAIGYYFGEQDLFYYDPGDPESLRAILDRLAAEPETLQQYTQRALCLREKFLWGREKAKYLALLSEFAGSPERSRKLPSATGSSANPDIRSS